MPEQNHIKQLCNDVLEKLMVVIRAQLDQLEAKDDLDQELQPSWNLPRNVGHTS